jgi:hypothetical protein
MKDADLIKLRQLIRDNGCYNISHVSENDLSSIISLTLNIEGIDHLRLHSYYNTEVFSYFYKEHNISDYR